MKQWAIFFGAVALVVLVVSFGVYRAGQHAQSCPKGTIYSYRLDVCMVGSQPWNR